jgi:hypothetical protein
MKVSVVPAQVTTIEDRIAGNLGMSQLLLLALPIFGGSALFAGLPPAMHNATYKLVLVSLLAAACCILAIRIRGKLILHWLVVMASYNTRPRHYIYDKRSLAGRPPLRTKAEAELVEAIEALPTRERRLLNLSTAEIIRIQSLMENPAANLSFKRNKRGDLRVLITEVKG